MADLRARMSPSSSSPFSFRRAASLASLASFFFLCLSAFLFRQSRMCVAEDARRMGRRQCLHWIVSTLSSRGRPVGNPASVFSSRGLTTGEPVAGALLSASAVASGSAAVPLQPVWALQAPTLCLALFPVSSFRRLGRRLFDFEVDFLSPGLHGILHCAAVQEASSGVHGACCCRGQSVHRVGESRGPPLRAPSCRSQPRCGRLTRAITACGVRRCCFKRCIEPCREQR